MSIKSLICLDVHTYSSATRVLFSYFILFDIDLKKETICMRFRDDDVDYAEDPDAYVT